MPKASKVSKADLARLARLEHAPGRIIAGGKRRFGLYVRASSTEQYQPVLALWLDATSGFVYQPALLDPRQDEGYSGALRALVQAILTPMQDPNTRSEGLAIVPPPALPERIIVNDEALAQAASAIFTPLKVAVAYEAEIPVFEEAYQKLAQQMGASDDATPYPPFAWEVPLDQLTPLYEATARLWRRRPWEYIDAYPPIVITLGDQGPQSDVSVVYASVLGSLATIIGVVFYYDLVMLEQHHQPAGGKEYDDATIDAAIAQMRQMGAPIDGIPIEELRPFINNFLAMQESLANNQTPEYGNCLVCFFDAKDASDPSYLEWIGERHLKLGGREGVPSFRRTIMGGESRMPNGRETRALVLAFEALNEFLRQYRNVFEGEIMPFLPIGHELKATANILIDEAEVPVSASFVIPADFYETMDEEDEEEPLDMTPSDTLYQFKVSLEWMSDVWRRIELRGDQTLDDLHAAIQRAFKWDDDHLYSFFLSGKAWDQKTEYTSPQAAERNNDAARMRIDTLFTRKGKKFLYIFDFGDELRHTIVLEAITPEGVKKGTKYPRISETHGKAPPQYGGEEE